ncbi:MAG: nitrogen fixation protein NifQ [Proteobacteria bacterium]|nr:nitrogen fixation protein NifQ [Pseudomonadota bacterium]
MTAALPADILPAAAAADAPSYRDFLAHARYPGQLLTLAFAGVIVSALAAHRRPLIRGLAEADFDTLMQTFFPGLRLNNGTRLPSRGGDEYDDLVLLLMAHRSQPSMALEWLSHAIASASLFDNHLWQDMGLPSRAILSQLMQAYFPALAAKNAGDMKWKKFFYRQLCEQEEVLICKSPNCLVCSDYRNCFGPED